MKKQVNNFYKFKKFYSEIKFIYIFKKIFL